MCRRSARGARRVVKPGRPSEEYLLRKLIHCERCGARMHGTPQRPRRGCAATSAPPAATTATCEQTMLAGAAVGGAARRLAARLSARRRSFGGSCSTPSAPETAGHPSEDADRRRELTAPA